MSYRYLPANGLGLRDPRRPYVTGGLGDGVPVFIFDILEGRIYDGDGRMLMDRSRLLADQARIYMDRTRLLEGYSVIVNEYGYPSADNLLFGNWYDDIGGNSNGVYWDDLVGFTGRYVSSILSRGGLGIPSFAFVNSQFEISVPELSTYEGAYLEVTNRGAYSPSTGVLGVEAYMFLFSQGVQVGTIFPVSNDHPTWWKTHRWYLSEAEIAQIDWTDVQVNLYAVYSSPAETEDYQVDWKRLNFVIPQNVTVASRFMDAMSRFLSNVSRTFASVGRTLLGGGRSMQSGDRDLD